MAKISFHVPIKGQPQGSSSAHVIGGRAHIYSANKKLKPFRGVVTMFAHNALCEYGYQYDQDGAYFSQHLPVLLTLAFTFIKPKSAKKRTHMVVKPDLDKLVRGVCDALTGVIYYDDAQVVEIRCTKAYTQVEGVTITAEEVLNGTV